MIDFLFEIMGVESTSGMENSVAEYIKDNFSPAGAELEIQDIENGMVNLYYKWGKPEVIFCSHFDTVPPYIPPRIEGDTIYGRGSCDAKGQIACLAEVCKRLHEKGETNFGLLMLAGEEVGSYGARAANKVIQGCKYVIVGEPTENKLIKAQKGNMLAEARFFGKAFHSGYPEHGDNAIQRMVDFVNRMNALEFPIDPLLGKTTYNIGNLSSDNARNIISDYVSMKIFFRTTFLTHDILVKMVNEITDDRTKIEFAYGDRPIEFHTVDGFETGVVSYGSDAPELPNLGKPMMYGPGSIFTAHTHNEHIKIPDMQKAVEDVMGIYERIK